MLSVHLTKSSSLINIVPIGNFGYSLCIKLIVNGALMKDDLATTFELYEVYPLFILVIYICIYIYLIRSLDKTWRYLSFDKLLFI